MDVNADSSRVLTRFRPGFDRLLTHFHYRFSQKKIKKKQVHLSSHIRLLWWPNWYKESLELGCLAVECSSHLPRLFASNGMYVIWMRALAKCLDQPIVPTLSSRAHSSEGLSTGDLDLTHLLGHKHCLFLAASLPLRSLVFTQNPKIASASSARTTSSQVKAKHFFGHMCIRLNSHLLSPRKHSNSF